MDTGTGEPPREPGRLLGPLGLRHYGLSCSTHWTSHCFELHQTALLYIWHTSGQSSGHWVLLQCLDVLGTSSSWFILVPRPTPPHDGLRLSLFSSFPSEIGRKSQELSHGTRFVEEMHLKQCARYDSNNSLLCNIMLCIQASSLGRASMLPKTFHNPLCLWNRRGHPPPWNGTCFAKLQDVFLWHKKHQKGLGSKSTFTCPQRERQRRLTWSDALNPSRDQFFFRLVMLGPCSISDTYSFTVIGLSYSREARSTQHPTSFAWSACLFIRLSVHVWCTVHVCQRCQAIGFRQSSQAVHKPLVHLCLVPLSSQSKVWNYISFLNRTHIVESTLVDPLRGAGHPKSICFRAGHVQSSLSKLLLACARISLVSVYCIGFQTIGWRLWPLWHDLR